MKKTFINLLEFREMKLWAEYDREGQVSRRFSSLADRHFPILGVGQVSRVQCSCRRRLNINKDDIIHINKAPKW